jgi:hypothetical protein
MRGSDERTGELFSYVDIEEHVPRSHPLRLIRRIVNEVLAELDSEFALYADDGRPSSAPERLLRALLLQALYTIRSERQLMEQLQYNLLYRWFVGLKWRSWPGFRPRLGEADASQRTACCRTNTSQMDVTQIRNWAAKKRGKDGSGNPPGGIGPQRRVRLPWREAQQCDTCRDHGPQAGV